MLSTVQSMALQGLNGYLVSIQVDISAGLPHFEIVRVTRCKCKKKQKKELKTAIKKYARRDVKQKK